jgi:hypothetical protein
MKKKDTNQNITLEEFFNRAKGREFSKRKFTISAKVMRDANNETVILHALATFELEGNKQQSLGFAWTTAADGVTPKSVDQLKVIVEAGGTSVDSQFISSTSKNSFGFKQEFASVPQKVTATAVSRGPDIEVTDTSDD